MHPMWDSHQVSFDVFFQRFRNGDAEPGGGDAMREVLAPYIVREEPEHSFAEVKYGDGMADVYLSRNSMMANHISGTEPWDLLVRGARAANWVIIPVRCPTCITEESEREHLPDGLGDAAVLVANGDDLLRVIQAS